MRSIFFLKLEILYKRSYAQWAAITKINNEGIIKNYTLFKFTKIFRNIPLKTKKNPPAYASGSFY